MKIKDQTDHYLAKQKLYNLAPSRLNSKEESDKYNKLLSEITEYEISTGMISDDDFRELKENSN